MKVTVVLNNGQLAAIARRAEAIRIMTSGGPPRQPVREQELMRIGELYDDEADLDAYLDYWKQDEQDASYVGSRLELTAYDAILVAAAVDGWSQ